MSDFPDDDRFVPMHPIKVIVILLGIALGFVLASYLWPLESKNPTTNSTNETQNHK